MPAEKHPRDAVFAATICERGTLWVRTARVGPDTTLGRIVQLVEEAEAAKAPVQRFADRFTAYYIPVVLGVAVLTYLIELLPSAPEVRPVRPGHPLVRALPEIVRDDFQARERRG